MNRYVLITGASTGIGEACARYLDDRGFHVLATVRRDADASRLRRDASERLRTLFLDVTDAGVVAAMAREVAAIVKEAGLYGLVNNAGIAVADPLELLPLDRFRQQLEVNVVGVVAVTQALLPLLRRARGRIVHMGSIGGRSVLPFVGAYCASKFALEALTDAMRMELRPWGIEVSIVEPGSVATPIWAKGEAMADRLFSDGEEADLYRTPMEALRRAVRGTGTKGAPPEAVARVVHHALTASRPRTRYLVGRMARVRALLQRLPDRWRDRLLLRKLGRA